MNIDGKQFRYNIGKKFIEIRSDDGKELIERKDMEFVEDGPITPKMIRDYILGKLSKDPSKYFPTCQCTGVDKRLRVDPFAAEIHQKVIWEVMCEDCYNKSAGCI